MEAQIMPRKDIQLPTEKAVMMKLAVHRVITMVTRALVAVLIKLVMHVQGSYLVFVKTNGATSFMVSPGRISASSTAPVDIGLHI